MDTGNEAEVQHVAEVVEYDDLNLETFDRGFSQLESRNPGPSGKFDFLLAREWVIRRTAWTTLQARDITLVTIQPFQDVGLKPQVTAIRDLHYMWRMDVEITVEVVSTFNMSGAIMVIPCHADWVPGYPTSASTAPVELLALLPHYVCFASDQNVIKFTLPFQSQYDYALTKYTNKGTNEYNPLLHWSHQWTVFLKVMHPLTNSTGTGGCEVITRARVADHEFVLPHIEEDESVAQGSKKVRAKPQLQSGNARSARNSRKAGETAEAETAARSGVVSDFLRSGARFASWVGNLTGFDSVGSAVAGVADALGNGAEAMGFQKPAEVSAPQMIAFNGIMDKRTGHSRGVADAFTFNIGENNDQSIDENLYGFSTQTNDFREYACIPGIVETGAFDASTAQGTLLGEVPIYPHLWSTMTLGATFHSPAWVATQFCRAYTGDLQHMLVFSSSKFVTTKIAIQIGTHLSGTPTLGSIGDTYTKVLTLNGSGVVKFRTPFIHPRRVCEVDVLTDNQLHVHMFLLSQSVQAPGDTAQGIATHFDWYAAFAPNCRFFVPVPDGSNALRTAWPAGFARERQPTQTTTTDLMAIQCDPRAEFRNLFEPFVESRMLAYDDALFPDEILHWNDIRMKPAMIVNTAGNPRLVTNDQLYATSTGASDGNFTYRPVWQKAYARWRCTMRYIVAEQDQGEVKLFITGPMQMQRGLKTDKDSPMNLGDPVVTRQYDHGGLNMLTRVVEVPRWRSTNYDARTIVPTGCEVMYLRQQTYYAKVLLPTAWQAGDSTVGFVPMGLWTPA